MKLYKIVPYRDQKGEAVSFLNTDTGNVLFESQIVKLLDDIVSGKAKIVKEGFGYYFVKYE
jgi:hypothetical protein